MTDDFQQIDQLDDESITGIRVNASKQIDYITSLVEHELNHTANLLATGKCEDWAHYKELVGESRAYNNILRRLRRIKGDTE